MITDLQRDFTRPLLQWFKTHGRQDLPWQHPRTPYRVFISEIMLQQTQVKTVLPYFERFMARFPDIQSLAAAHEDEVLAHWSGLGYYSRARHLHSSAQIVTKTYNGKFPSQLEKLIQLPGIGPSTAAAIASLAFNQPTPILDGNVKRVLARYFKIKGLINDKKVETRLLGLANQCMSKTQCANYTQAIMDLGATCCRPKQPTCVICPLKNTCTAYQQQCVSVYPTAKPKKSLPTQHHQFLLIGHDNAIFLEKRPQQGIWGGLWCLPTLAMETDIPTYLNQTFGLCEDLAIHPFKTFKHSFTHFHLTLHAYTISISTLFPTLLTQKWVNQPDLPQLGLPKPILTLLTDFWLRHPPTLNGT